ncbi:hypothetical protein [Candidatus Magnetobacterium casense]|uniref:Uncharacterized protein n=1 Tax=Candidatus Magnetobacterium casense TaxID=1455061 RepID=A0ABS6RXG5_9BACT|nr:hypothetical protein [Candidatus Magnetobacterium casensis]MBV6341311.1 hypothetical protein [Candidatus Magnetobacterium casensis]
MNDNDYINRLKFYQDLLRSEQTKINPDYDKIIVYKERINYMEKILSANVLGMGSSNAADTLSNVAAPPAINSDPAKQSIHDLFANLSFHQQQKVILKLIEQNEKTDMKKAILIVQDLGAHSKIVAGLPDMISRYKFKQFIADIEIKLYDKHNIKKGQLAGDGRFNVCFNRDDKKADTWVSEVIDYCFGMIDGIREISKINRVYAPLYIRFGLHAGNIQWDANLPSEENIAIITSPEANLAGHLEKEGKKYRKGDGSIIIISKDVFDMLSNTRKQMFKKEKEKIDDTTCYTYEENL